MFSSSLVLNLTPHPHPLHVSCRPYNVQQMLNWALEPADEDMLAVGGVVVFLLFGGGQEGVRAVFGGLFWGGLLGPMRCGEEISCMNSLLADPHPPARHTNAVPACLPAFVLPSLHRS